MNLYASSTLYWSKPIPDVLREIAKLGLTGVEIWAEQIDNHQTTIRDIQRIQAELALAYTVHAPSWDLNITSINQAIRERSLGEIERAFETAALLKAKSITVHPGQLSLTNQWLHWHREQQVKSTARLVDFSKQYGVGLTLELMERKPKETVTSPEAMNELLRALNYRFGVTFDVAHIALNEDVVQAYLRTENVEVVHLSDTSSSIYHIGLGEGEQQLHPILQLLSKETVPVVLEGMSASGGMLKRHLAYLEAFSYRKKEDLYEVSSYK
ncbi:sugar phosphate isomerase/epimerase [Alkalihalobacillus xiaoxiensis]|uniref:Sugar phosphate isomerase/epimerase n=1 Tax=Shouchella xiaoxiensis TaxID=766895 RepID=A0ABS2SUF9_9BACI|nr:sugar phosphate isomerase/epimerase family protein [Shouchella xiaoxiensis]MBM7839179.1 sugar phosphate isomerase/epimerase [Shouchella xiaoxiensis]